MMPLEDVAARFARNAAIIRALGTCPEEQARWKPEPKRWSVLEVVCHLLDEEREDFRARLDILLHHPEQPWTPNDPEGWVVQRAYNATDPDDTLAAFLAERRASLAWLASLTRSGAAGAGAAGAAVAPDWNCVRVHKVFGELRAGDLLAAWLRHDLLHIRQLVALHAEWEKARSLPFQTAYAGG